MRDRCEVPRPIPRHGVRGYRHPASSGPHRRTHSPRARRRERRQSGRGGIPARRRESSPAARARASRILEKSTNRRRTCLTSPHHEATRDRPRKTIRAQLGQGALQGPPPESTCVGFLRRARMLFGSARRAPSSRLPQRGFCDRERCHDSVQLYCCVRYGVPGTPGVKIDTIAPIDRASLQVEHTASDSNGSFELFNYPLQPVILGGEVSRGLVLFSHPDYVDQGIGIFTHRAG